MSLIIFSSPPSTLSFSYLFFDFLILISIVWVLTNSLIKFVVFVNKYLICEWKLRFFHRGATSVTPWENRVKGGNELVTLFSANVYFSYISEVIFLPSDLQTWHIFPESNSKFLFKFFFEDFWLLLLVVYSLGTRDAIETRSFNEKISTSAIIVNVVSYL